jgi:hypothetical protein
MGEFLIGVVVLGLIWAYLEISKDMWFDYPDNDYLDFSDEEDEDE